MIRSCVQVLLDNCADGLAQNISTEKESQFDRSKLVHMVDRYRYGQMSNTNIKTKSTMASAARPPSSSLSREACLLVALISCCCFSSSSSRQTCAQAFQSQAAAAQQRRSSLSPPHTSTALFAGGLGFGSSNNNSGDRSNKNGGKKKPKYTMDDKSYGDAASSPSSSMIANTQSAEEFFTTYLDWMPLFREHSMDHSTLRNLGNKLASATNDYDDDTLWGIATLEGRRPWRLLPSKPESTEPLAHLGKFLDEWQRSLLDIPIDTLTKEDEIGKGNNDLHFLEEGRRTIAVSRFHVLPASTSSGMINEEWENELFRICWSEMGHLMSQNVEDTGSLIVLPDIPPLVNFNDDSSSSSSLEYVQQFVQMKLLQPITWMGRHEDWEIVAMERGNLAVRLLYKLSAIPDLSEKYVPEDE